MDLSSKGITQDSIAIEFQVSQGTVSYDLADLKAEAQKHLEKHVTETLPCEYQKCKVGMKYNILEISDTATDPNFKLQVSK